MMICRRLGKDVILASRCFVYCVLVVCYVFGFRFFSFLYAADSADVEQRHQYATAHTTQIYEIDTPKAIRNNNKHI